MALPLTVCLGSDQQIWPVFDGSAKPDGIALNVMTVPPPELHWRQLRHAEFDIAEIGLRSLLIGDKRWVGIPVFPHREMFHTRILVRRDAGIDRPEDLKGKRVGVPALWMSAVMWTLGPLRDSYGLDIGDMEYWTERDPAEWRDAGDGPDSGEVYSPPAGVTMHIMRKPDNIATMMLARKLDAAFFYIGPANGEDLIEGGKIDLARHPDVKPLFPDPLAEGIRCFNETGIYPLNHVVVVRRPVVEAHPWVPLNLFKCFQRANEIMTRRRVEQIRYHIETGLISRDAAAALAEPVIRYGVAANRKVLQKYIDTSLALGIIRKRVAIEDCFAPSTVGF